MSSSSMFAIRQKALTAATLMLLSACATDPLTDSAEKFRDVPPDLEAVVDATDGQFMNRDAEAMGAIITDDFSGWSVTEDGPKVRVSGREQTVQMLEMFFAESPSSWVDSRTYRLGMVDNILVQVEEDVYATDTGERMVRTLNLYEFKDGKRWRNWKFFPVESRGD